jgi:hypothetical protein
VHQFALSRYMPGTVPEFGAAAVRIYSGYRGTKPT